MAAANDLRPVQVNYAVFFFTFSHSRQARGNLESMLRRQLELRREETQKLHEYVARCILLLYGC